MNTNASQVAQEKQIYDAIGAIFDRIDAFKTSRLWVLSWRPVLEDTSARAELATDLSLMLTEPVLRYLPEHVQLGHEPAAIQTWINDRNASAAIYLVRDGDGLAGLMFLFRPADSPTTEPLHLGYLFGEASWGKGYASEMAIGLVETLSNGPETTLQGGVDVNNPASARVLEKAGFVRDDALCSDGIEIFSRTVGRAQ